MIYAALRRSAIRQFAIRVSISRNILWSAIETVLSSLLLVSLSRFRSEIDVKRCFFQPIIEIDSLRA